MTALRMAFTELQRICAGRLRRVAVLCLVLVPTLYGGLYLYANHDPYANLDQVPAALVVLDTGSTDSTGGPVNAGREVADRLLDEHAFAWHEVSAATARDGVRDGTYDFALTVPADFSAALTSSGRFSPEKARLTMTTNDANSYLSSTIANTVTTRVRSALSQRVSSSAAEQFLLGFGEIRGSLQQAADGAAKLDDGLGTAADGVTTIATGSDKLSRGLAVLSSRTVDLPADTDRLADGAARVAAGNARIAQAGNTAEKLAIQARNAYYQQRALLVDRMRALGLSGSQQSQLINLYNQLESPVVSASSAVRRTAGQLRDLSSGAAEVASGSRLLATSGSALTAGITSAQTGAHSLATGAGDLQDGLTRLTDGSGQLSDKLADGLSGIPDVSEGDRAQIAGTIGDPVAIKNVSEAKADSYGAGLAPFFMALAAWIGGYVLFLLVRPLSRRAMAANQPPARVAFGGWLTPALAGVVQVTVLLGVVAVAVKIVPENLPGTWLFLILMSATFVGVVHALNAWFGAAGQFLGLVLMVLQLVTAGGTFPWQTIPQPLHGLHHVLPMGYAVDGLRQLMYGGLSELVARDALVLLAWLVAALAASTWAARRQRIWTVQRVKPGLALS